MNEIWRRLLFGFRRRLGRVPAQWLTETVRRRLKGGGRQDCLPHKAAEPQPKGRPGGRLRARGPAPPNRRRQDKGKIACATKIDLMEALRCE